MTRLPDKPDKADVQRLAVFGYTLNRSRHFVLQVTALAQARSFLAELLQRDLITDASVDNRGLELRQCRAQFPANIGFTFRGLEVLKLRAPYLRVFRDKSPAFAEGAWLRAARRLADTGASATRCWDACFAPDRAHVLLSIYADEIDELKEFSKALEKLPGAEGLDGWNTALDGCQMGDKNNRMIHFGFRDGISNPEIEGLSERKRAPESKAPKAHAAGEFILGYANDNEYNPWLLADPLPARDPWLLPSERIDPTLFRNASFAAFRKIEQHERPFREFVSGWAARLGVREEYVRAKLAGRWDDGSVLRPGVNSAPLPAGAGSAGADEDEALNDFDFSDDPNGEGCPFGAHIRRMNPRADQVVPFRGRPLIRRGMPYGRRYEDAPAERRGLLGLFFCASLEDQFEHLLAQWANANPMGPDNHGNAKDPLIGNHENTRAVFDLPMPDDSLRQIDGFTPFVTTRGTLYAFYPGLAALGRIAGADARICSRG